MTRTPPKKNARAMSAGIAWGSGAGGALVGAGVVMISTAFSAREYAIPRRRGFHHPVPISWGGGR